MPLAVALGVTMQIGSAPDAHAVVDYAQAAYDVMAGKHLNMPEEVAAAKVELLDLVTEAGTDPDSLERIMYGIDRAIGGESTWDWAPAVDVYRTVEQSISELFFDPSKYSGVATDDAWKDVGTVYAWQIQPLGYNEALIKLNNTGVFLWTRAGTAEYAQSDASLGFQRCAWAVGGCVYTEPGSVLTMTMLSFGPIPTSVKVGGTIKITPTFSVAPWRVMYMWSVCAGTPKLRRFFGTSPSYTTIAADDGCGIVVDVIASKAGYTVVGGNSRNILRGYIQVGGPTPPTPPVTKAFSKVYTPTISGTVRVGKTLTAHVAAWSPTASFSYQWRRNGTVIPTATKSTYKLVATDLNTTITVQATGTRTGYTTTSKVSKSTKSIALGSLSKGKITVTGTRRVGKTLTAKPSKWSSGVTYHYKWYRNSAAIIGATTKTYALAVTDKGARFKVKVWTTKDGYKTSASRTSSRTAKVKG